ncbi:beta-lactamase family protein [Paenibacillus albidus]|uniref:serine hydrolase n=1 Tax=Paenibacillus albidus TaxID=2041023 RepID=UPI001BEC2B34|nr:serine hydrolase [Paenibacillus albidus]MBT2291403.1 beta-lactamase family protein [Paenibacillus albidus]
MHTDIQQYLGGMKLDNPFKTPVTVHHLLTHTSGFQVVIDQEDEFSPALGHPIPLQDYIKKKKPSVVREPGTAYMYDNYAYNLLGYIIANRSCTSYPQYMQEQIFNPLGMEHTQSVLTKALIPRIRMDGTLLLKAVISLASVHLLCCSPSRIQVCLWCSISCRYYPAEDAGKRIYLDTPRQQLARFEGRYTDLRVFMLLTQVTATGSGELTVKDANGSHKLMQRGPLLFEDENGQLLAFKEEKDGSVIFAKKLISSFMDLQDDSPYTPSIHQLEAIGLLQGTSEKQYHPTLPVTRAEFAALLVRTMGTELAAAGGINSCIKSPGSVQAKSQRSPERT